MSEEVATTENIPSISKPESLKKFSKELKQFIVEMSLYTPIQGKNYVNVEGWQFAGMSMGLVSIIEKCERLEREGDEIAYRSEVALYHGEKKVGYGMAICSSKEAKRKTADEYVIASMSQTRATGKAYRLLLAPLMKMAGYEGTPSEDMEGVQPERGTDIPTYCADCGKVMVAYVKGPKKGQLHCKGKGAAPGQNPSCPPKEKSEVDQRISDELDGIPIIQVKESTHGKDAPEETAEEMLSKVGF